MVITRSRVQLLRRAYASDLPVVVLTGLGLSLVATGASVIGAGVVALLLTVLLPLGADVTGGGRTALIASASGYVPFAAVVGTLSVAWVQRRTVVWLALGRTPTHAEARRALRLPLDTATITVVLWALGTVVLGGVTAGVADDARATVRVVSAVALGGLTTAGVTYLLVGRLTRPVAVRALAAHPPTGTLTLGVLQRLMLTWVLSVAVPLLGVLLVVLDPPETGSVRGAVAFLVGVALIVGGLSTALAARSVSAPLRALRRCLREVGRGDFDGTVTVDDAGEIGLLQTGVNSMLDGLRERERIRDLFGRHVGPAVVAHTLETGVTLDGETRDVVALFVDVTGSTTLAGRVEPQDLVRMLNRLFSVVVDAVEETGGLVNKFEGDAALCIFGAPVALADPATAALTAARRIRDAVRAAGELDVGIGVAAGPVVAGQVGAHRRLEYTVIGDPVNEAARLTDLAKEHAGRLLASAPVVEAATAEEQRHWARRDPVPLRGRSEVTVVYEAAG